MAVVAVTEADRREYQSNQRRSTDGMRIGGDGRGTPVKGAPVPVFPDSKPAFVAGDVRVSPRGEVWVKRTYRAGSTSADCDIFDSSGKRVAIARIPADARIMGFGRDAVYLVRTDADGLQTLERYRY